MIIYYLSQHTLTMEDNKGDAQGTPWPVPQFHFKVTIGNLGDVVFQEVSGLDTEYDTIEYRNVSSVDFKTVKMPGVRKMSDITLKKGIFKGDSPLYDYFAGVKMNTVARQAVTIALLDESHAEIFIWTLKNAFPKKVTGASLNAKSSEASIEDLVLAHEGLTMDKK